MVKYHINKHGVPAVCMASERPCPLGPHFKTEAKAAQYIKEDFSKQYGLIPPSTDTRSIVEKVDEQLAILSDRNIERRADEAERTRLAKLSLKEKGSINTSAEIGTILDGIHTPDSGATFSMRGTNLEVTIPQVGFCASPYPELSKVFNASNEVTASGLMDYMDSVNNIDPDLLGDENTYIGLWNDPESGKVYLDISRRYDTAEQARISCENHDQIAYFDLQSFESVDVDRNAMSGQTQENYN